MSDALENYKKYPNLTEAYEVVQTVEVVVNKRIYQIEVLKCYSNPPIHYEISYWELEHVYLQPSYPRSDGPQGPDASNDTVVFTGFLIMICSSSGWQKIFFIHKGG